MDKFYTTSRYWTLRDAVALDAVEQFNGRLALALGADARSSDAARILRPAGSTNWKSRHPAAVRLIALDEQRSVDAAVLDRQLPALSARSSGRRRAAGEDRLLAVAPRVYVERLTGERVGRSDKVRSPLAAVGEKPMAVDRPGWCVRIAVAIARCRSCAGRWRRVARGRRTG